MRNRKLFVRGQVLEVATRCVAGLPMVASAVVKEVLLGELARAQKLAPVKLSHFVMMANHFHMIFVVLDPYDVSKFMQIFKTRTAHHFNKMMGRTGKFWDDRYDSPVVLEPSKLVERLVYIYSNPQAANLVECIEEYPHLNTWSLVSGTEVSKTHVITAKIFSRSMVPVIPRGRLSEATRVRLYSALIRENYEESSLIIEPRSCFEAYGFSDEMIEFYLRKVRRWLRYKEQLLADKRRKAKRKVIGAAKLISADMFTRYTPTKRGMKMICLAHCRKIRANYISEFKKVCELCREVFEMWKEGYDLAYPLCAFAPSKPSNVRVLKAFVVAA